MSIFVKRQLLDEQGELLSTKSSDDASSENKIIEGVHWHNYKVDFVMNHRKKSDDLMLHWGVSRDEMGAWGKPDEKHWPKNSVEWADGFSVQTTFNRENDNEDIRTLSFEFEWVEGQDPPITSMSFVMVEKNEEKDKNKWNNIHGKDGVIIFEPFEVAEPETEVFEPPTI